MASEHGRQALHRLDTLLADRPSRSGHDFSAATRCLTAFRDEVVQAWRASGSDADRARLDTVNSVLSAVLGGYFPRGTVPWEEIAQARGMLARVVEGQTVSWPALRDASWQTLARKQT
jgi:hypothetical protein